MSTKSFVVDYLLERGAEIDELNYSTYDFVTPGIIDSFEIMAFLLEIESVCGIRIEPEAFVEREFRYVLKLVEYLDEQRK